MTKSTDTILVLRTCASDMTSYQGFKWPKKGLVEAPDWQPTAACGNGLHGLPWGVGNGGLLDWSDEAKWLVVEVAKTDLIEFDGKCKFSKGSVKFCGGRDAALKYLEKHADVLDKAVVGSTRTAGDGGTATAGDGGTATAGYGGTATAGDGGTATAGDGGTATAGDGGTATAGYRGTATAGDGGCFSIKWWDSGSGRYRVVWAYVGEDGIESNVAYRLNKKHKCVKVV